MISKLLIATSLLICSIVVGQLPDSLPTLTNGNAPQTFEQMWGDYDPRSEPLETETIREWEEDGVLLRVVRFRIGVFKGREAKLAAIFGIPKNIAGTGTRIPGLVQIHGGGQYADHRACLMNAKRGYATVSIAWAGRISAPEYRVSPDEVKLFWDGKTQDPAYRLTTDWGAVDGYHAPGRNPKNHFPSVKPASWTMDDVESPRNSPWFLCAIAARRALTFLEQQPKVDPARLGVYGHSMGGKLTVMTSVDSRVKAAAPSCGGISDRDNDSKIFETTIGDDVSLSHIKCPIIFLSPSNDFHGRIGDLPRAIDEIQTESWRVTCSPHRSHQDTGEYEVASLLWFDEHLRGRFAFPETPATKLQFDGDSGTPSITIHADTSREVKAVDVFYTQHGKEPELASDRDSTVHRFWRHAATTASDDNWTATLPLVTIEKPLWVYANVTYGLDEAVMGAGYYYRIYAADSFVVSSLIEKVSPDQLNASGATATLKPSLMIESFADGWQQEWFTTEVEAWPRSTHKLFDQQFRAPASDARLAWQVRCDRPNKLVVLIDEHAALVDIKQTRHWQDIELSSSDFRNHAGDPLANWNTIRVLKLSNAERLIPGPNANTKPKILGKVWQGADPDFRNLRWVTKQSSPRVLDQ